MMSKRDSNFLNQFHLANPPNFLLDSVRYLVIVGSQSYGVSTSDSDLDVIGFCIPPKEVIFPHLRGEILGFGTPKERFEQYVQHHLPYKGKTADITIYNIVKFFQLAMQGNPNIVDTLFVPKNCVLTNNPISDLLRDNRKLFLHKGCWHRFKGYAYSQISKIRKRECYGSRTEIVEKYGYDVKFAYHVVRLLNEVEQILLLGDLDLQQNNAQLKSIRNGEWTISQIEQYFVDKEKQLEELYLKSNLPYYPQEEKIKELLLKCLDIFYTDLCSNNH